MRTPQIFCLLVLSGLQALLLIPNAGAQQKKGAPKVDTFLTGPPFTFDQVFRFIQENVIPQKRQRDAIQARGVDFAPSPDVLEEITRGRRFRPDDWS